MPDLEESHVAQLVEEFEVVVTAVESVGLKYWEDSEDSEDFERPEIRKSSER
jgi:hypothetical protein